MKKPQDLHREQIKQEVLYNYPYHYIPVLNPNQRLFSQVQLINWGYEYLSYLSFIIDRLKHYKFKSLLDVGCGDGRFIYELEKEFTDKEIIGIDFSARAIQMARCMCPQGHFICGDITDPEVMKREFDVITLIETLEHIPPRMIDAFIEAIYQRVSEGGMFVLSVPTKNIKTSKKHFQHFDIEGLEHMLNPMFKIERCYYTNKKSYLVRRLRKLLHNKYFIFVNEWACWKLYKIYKAYFFHANESNAKRIILFCLRT